MAFEEILKQYGPSMGLILIVVMSTLPTITSIVKAMGISKAAKVTADAEVVQAQAEVVQAQAETQRVEADTQRGMNNIALQMLEERRAYDIRLSDLNDKLTDVRVLFAEVGGEYKAYREGQTTIVGNLQSQIQLTEKLWQSSKEAKNKLEIELVQVYETLKQQGNDLKELRNAFDAANTISEARRKENEQLRQMNGNLEEEKTILIQKIATLETKVAAVEEENVRLKERVAILERDKTTKDNSEPAAILPVLVSTEEQ